MWPSKCLKRIRRSKGANINVWLHCHITIILRSLLQAGMLCNIGYQPEKHLKLKIPEISTTHSIPFIPIVLKFLQSTAVSSVFCTKFQTIRWLNNKLRTQGIAWYFSLRWVLGGYPIVHNTKMFVATWAWMNNRICCVCEVMWGVNTSACLHVKMQVRAWV